jgi:hypothetical protein
VNLRVDYGKGKKRLTDNNGLFTTRILGVIGRSKVPLSANEVRKIMKQKFYPGSDCRFVYQKLKQLTPTTDEIPGIRLFCYDDFIEKNDADTNEKLVKKLEKAYGDRLKWKWKEITPYFKSNPSTSCNKVVKKIKIEQDSNNLIDIELVPPGGEDNQNDNKDSQNYNNKIAKMILIHNGARFTPPLITKRKNKKWYVYSLSSETYHSNRELRTYLIDKSNQYSMNLRGFLKYLAGESSDNNRIDKTIETLSECDKYVSIKDQEFMDNSTENGQDLFRTWNYQIKENFPFLSFYKDIKKFLPEKFAAKLLKDIALELQNRLEGINIEDLKYEVTSRYYYAIANYFWSVNNPFGVPLILSRDRIDLESRNMIIKYQLEIHRYINHNKQKETLQSEKVYAERCNYYDSTNLQAEIEHIIDTYSGDDNIISIDEVQKFSLPYSRFKDVIESVERRYKDKYAVVGDLYLISNSKIEKLKQLVTPGITYKKACSTFTKYNIPEFCHNSLIHKLGFEFGSRKGEKYNYRNPTIVKPILEPWTRFVAMLPNLYVNQTPRFSLYLFL